ncbi:class I SAM-dependent methyltransferase [Hufsiella ginkgonis]|uniref:Methyltransferase domain-containing protein n=1 Tax=Hufsiella ginkgonis TaxID=2695274 RepID=A0A7K1Y493_9SPHI|nr:class I SAM-dependent methyltransferase [Hufsiella ginkgonis]MXV17687.1 methyltransferase domain-containing protein [Hufsiella ginkgonis]
MRAINFNHGEQKGITLRATEIFQSLRRLAELLAFYLRFLWLNFKTQRGFVKPGAAVVEKSAGEAYDLWSESYDFQSGNLMLDLDEKLSSGFISRVDLTGKHVADIGCGTGRHWPKLFERMPRSVTGFDVSPGMLEKLKNKFPLAKVRHIENDLLLDTPDGSFDVIVSTLTMAHIPGIEAALGAWCRIAKPDAEIVITDFHPEILENGGKRTFSHRQTTIAVQNYVHPVPRIAEILQEHGFRLAEWKEITIDESMKHYYARRHALPVYEKYKGRAVIYGLHFKRGHGTE